MRLFVPTNEENLFNRLFIRYFLFYLCAILIGLAATARGTLLFTLGTAPLGSFLPVLLAAFAAVSTISNSYLVLLTACKGLYDAQLLWQATMLVRCGQIGIFYWNACFFLIAFSLVLFALCATNAGKFAFENRSRDLKLIFSKPFGKFLLEAFFLIMLAFVLYLLWLRILTKIPSL